MPDVKTGETAKLTNHKGSYYYVIPYIWKNTTVIKQREVMSITDCFYDETPHGKTLWTNQFFGLSFIFLPGPNTQDKIFHMLANEHNKIIKER